MSELENEIQQPGEAETPRPAGDAAAEPEPGPAPEAGAKPAPGTKPADTKSEKAEGRQGGQKREPRDTRDARDTREPKDKGQRPPREGGREGGREGAKPSGPDRRGPRPGGPPGRDAKGGGRPDLAADIDLEKLIADSLYLDNQAHAVVSRMRDMDSGTRSQLRRLYSAIRRACRATEADRQHQFVMLRARLAYTIARHQLRSLDGLERLLLQVTRKNDARGYERFRDLFEAIVAYNE